MEVRFRRADVADAAILAALINSAYRGDGSRAGWTTEAHLLDGQRTDADALAAELSDPRIEQYLAIDADDRLLGTYRWQLDPHGSGAGYVGMISVVPGEQRAGVGRALLADAERVTRERGCPALLMWVISQREELRAYYERRGYADTGERIAFPYDQPRFGIPRVPGLEFAVHRKEL